jgi:hypothetical protein
LLENTSGDDGLHRGCSGLAAVMPSWHVGIPTDAVFVAFIFSIIYFSIQTGSACLNAGSCILSTSPEYASLLVKTNTDDNNGYTSLLSLVQSGY